MAANAMQGAEFPIMSSMRLGAVVSYRTLDVEGLPVFYREAGAGDGPVVLCLHGFPSSSRMFEPLLQRLAGARRFIAPDLIGFGHSAAPPPTTFRYTFDRLTDIVEGFVQALDLRQFTLVVQDYGGPVGFRLAERLPDRINGLIVQNAVAYEEGLGPLWDTRRAFWKDRDAHEASLKENFFSAEATRLRHVGRSPHPERYDPDLWCDEKAFLSRPGQQEIQLDLFFDYQSNVILYPRWQAWLRRFRPPTLVLWGIQDPSFQVAAAHAFKRDVPEAEVHELQAGHFPMDEAADEIAELTASFLARRLA